MVNTAQTQKRELEIEKMIITLIDHDWYQQFNEDTKTLANKKKKDKSAIIEKEYLTTLLSTKKNKRKKRCKQSGL